MSDIKWIKLSTQMFEDEKIRLIESMPESDTILIIWVKLLSQAGRTNASGYIYLNENIAYTDEMLSTIFNRPLPIVRMALKVFRDFGMIDIDENNFISIENWEKHQNVETLDKIREQTKKRVEKHRKSKQKVLPNTAKNQPEKTSNVTSNVTVTNGNATELELDLELELEGELDKELDKDLQQQDLKEKEKNDDVVVAESPGIAFRFYENNISLLSPYVAENLGKMIDESSEEMVCEALKRSVEADGVSNKLRYADSILRNWMQKNIKTLSDVEAADKAFERNKQRKSTGFQHKPVREERLPEWFNKPAAESESNAPAANSADLEAEKKALLKRLAEKKGANK